MCLAPNGLQHSWGTDVRVFVAREHVFDAYAVLFALTSWPCMVRVLPRTGISKTFPEWLRRNRESIAQFYHPLRIHPRHVLRGASYKGTAEAEVLSDCEHDCATALGLLFLFQISFGYQAAKIDVQIKMLRFLRRLLSILQQPFDLQIAPGLNIRIRQCSVSIPDMEGFLGDRDLHRRSDPLCQSPGPAAVCVRGRVRCMCALTSAVCLL
jgi:hypothetical protein